MMPSLIADDDNPSFPPKTESYLLVGGPKHGQRVDIIDSDRIFRTFGPVTPQPAAGGLNGNAFTQFPGATVEPHTYVRRDLGFRDEETGEQYVRAVFVHEGIPNPDVAQQFLMAALLADFVKGGRKVIEEDGRS